MTPAEPEEEMKLQALALVTTAAAALAFAAPALAKTPYGYSQPAAYTENEIVVVPYGIQRYETGRRTSIGGREEMLTLSRVVTADGLNLRYEADAAELYRRIDATARDICNELDRAAMGSSTTDRECIRDAVREARPHADAMIYRARY